MKRVGLFLAWLILIVQSSYGAVYYVAINGNDGTGDGSSGKPWRTLQYAISKVAAGQGHTVRLGAGTFVENAFIQVPLGVSIEGAGMDVTFIKGASSLYYNPAAPGYATDKYLLMLKSGSAQNGDQNLKGFTIDGDGKRIHGGIFVQNRNNVVIENIKIKDTNFNAIWLWDVKDSKILNSRLYNNSWATTSWSSGAINIGNTERVEIANCYIDENKGYGIKAIGPSGDNLHVQLKIHDCHITVAPNSPSSSNIAVELWKVKLVNCHMYNCYLDNDLSLVNEHLPATGTQTIRVNNNTFDLNTRAGGSAYGIELTLPDAEIDNNYFLGGRQGIVNWGPSLKNWRIHHNVFYGLNGNGYPGDVIRAQQGLADVKFYNNTVEFAGTTTVNLVSIQKGVGSNLDIANNLIINSNTSYNAYPNKIVHVETGASVSNLKVVNNLLFKMAQGNVTGTYSNNLTADPEVSKSGNRPSPFYVPKAQSPLIDAGIDVGLGHKGSRPDIGAYEYETTAPSNQVPVVSITSPANNTSFNTGASITIGVTAADKDGSISKVEFFSGTTKLGEDATSPYSFDWNNATAGTHQITAKATDNAGSKTTSAPITITVTAPVAPTVSISSPANNASFKTGASITIDVTATDKDGSISKVEFFSGTTKLGEDTTSPYSFTWSTASEGTHRIIAKATDNSGAATNSTAINVTVESVSSILPQVSITSPLNNSKTHAGQRISISASASVADGKIKRVEFYNGSHKLGQDATHPYRLNWYNVPEGNHKITAKAIDNMGRTATSAIVNVAVSSLPVVAITSPSNGAVVTEGSDVTLTANASREGGSISKVEFFRGITKVGEDTSSPYSCIMRNVKSGTARIVAKATDNLGVSQQVQITLNINALPTVRITAPVNSAAFKIGTTVDITADALDRDGSVRKVEFFAGSTKLAEDTSSPFSFAWKTSALGSFNLTAKATDNRGATRTSPVIAIRVVESATTRTDEGGIIVVNPGEESQIKVPRVFSPNDDGINDVWKWENMEQYENCTLSVFNRIGNKIYETSSYQNNWDGKVDGKPLPEDAYYYVITCENNEIMGAVRIVR